MKLIEKYKKTIKSSSKISLFTYFFLRILIIICMIKELISNNIENVMLCLLSLVLFMLPAFIEKKFKIELPTALEVTVFMFIFAAEILGTINNFYNIFPRFDDMLHTINGFLAASVGFSLIYLLNNNITNFKLSPFFVSLFAFCFSMTIGVVWEFYEYSMDTIFNMDTQKDTILYQFKDIEQVDYTLIYGKNDEVHRLDGYLDIGLNDTMHDLIVNFVGALVYCILGYSYLHNKDKYRVVDKLLITKANL